jgi:quercetin dioxygenase-like cupin family protein
MIKRNIKEFWRGWFIGNFEPSILKTDQFEVALINHVKDEKWSAHYHAIATEYNLLVSGKMQICGETIEPGDIFVLEPNEIADPEFLEDCQVLCVKVPSINGDKYEVLS